MSHRPPRELLRRFTLGRGPLKRRSDRLEFASRLMVLLAVLLAVPFAIVVGRIVADRVAATAHAQAQERHQVAATVLADAPPAASGDVTTVPANATWATPSGPRQAAVPVPVGTRAGTVVRIWVDRGGAVTVAPLGSSDVAAEGVTAGVIAGLGLMVVAGVAHLTVLWLLDRHRAREWAQGWASVEPLWISRFR